LAGAVRATIVNPPDARIANLSPVGGSSRRQRDRPPAVSFEVRNIVAVKMRERYGAEFGAKIAAMR
jgi:hypothetical protein